MIILVDKDDHLGNYEKYHQRRDLVELTTGQERFVDQEKKVIVINVTMLVLSVFSVPPRRAPTKMTLMTMTVLFGEASQATN